MKDLLESRSNSRYTSSLAYRKKAEAIRGGKRDRYSLAEPKKVEVTCLMKHFQDTFSADKKITSKLMKALTKLTSSPNVDLQLKLICCLQISFFPITFQNFPFKEKLLGEETNYIIMLYPTNLKLKTGSIQYLLASVLTRVGLSDEMFH